MRQTFLAAAAALLLASPAIATAADPLPVGQAQGVRLTSVRGRAVFHFSKRAAGLHGQIAGRLVVVTCATLPRGDKLGPVPFAAVGLEARVPRRRAAPLRTRLVTRGSDVCTVALSDGQTDVVSVPLTQRGAVFLDEREKAGMLSALADAAGSLGDRTTPSAYPTPERFLASRTARAISTAGFPLVALASPDATPPAGAFGYWSDNARSAAFVTLSASGRRLYLVLGPDGAVSTNVAGALIGGPLFASR